MPTTYAHYRFGRDVQKVLPQDTQQLIEAHRPLFDFGVHGPDLLFYYKPLGKNEVNRTGNQIHEQPGRTFFVQAAAVVSKAPHQDAGLAYLYGVLCHYILDRECHPYVGQKEKSGVSHSAIESSFDRYLMLQDKLDPVTHRVTAHLHPSRASAAVIAAFYPPLTQAQIFHAERSMVFYLNALIASGLKRRLLLGGMRLSGHSEMGDMLIPLQQNPACADSDEILMGHYKDALSLATSLFAQLEDLLHHRGDLGPAFAHTFGET